MKSIYTVFLIMFFTVLVFTGLNSVAGEFSDNTNLDDDSRAYIKTLDSQLNNKDNKGYVNYTDVNFNNAAGFNSENIDAYSLQFQMGRTSAANNAEEMNFFTKTLSLPIYALGLESNEWTPYTAYIMWFLGIVLAMIVGVLIFGRGRFFPSGGEA